MSLVGLEPTTLPLWAVCSNHLNYKLLKKNDKKLNNKTQEALVYYKVKKVCLKTFVLEDSERANFFWAIAEKRLLYTFKNFCKFLK